MMTCKEVKNHSKEHLCFQSMDLRHKGNRSTKTIATTTLMLTASK